MTSDESQKMTEVDEETKSKTDAILLQPYHYISKIPGKHIRTKLANAFNYWLNIDQEKLELIGEIVQMLHNASLMIDDIEDNSKLRRGTPVAHTIFGIPSTINAANYVYFLGLEKALTLQHPQATAVFTEQLLELHRGQGMEIYWRDNFICPSEDEYKEMVLRKTGGLFRMAVGFMQLFSSKHYDFNYLIGLLGLYFQIRDDYANLKLKEYTENKSYCEDLTEGKFSFPVIHAIKSVPSDVQVLYILRQRTHDVDIKKYCVQLLENFGSFEYTKKTLLELENKIQDEITRLGGNTYLTAIMVELGSWRND